MLKLPQAILTELFKQIISQVVMQAYFRERKSLTCQGRSWQVAVTAKLIYQSSCAAHLWAAASAQAVPSTGTGLPSTVPSPTVCSVAVCCYFQPQSAMLGRSAVSSFCPLSFRDV